MLRHKKNNKEHTVKDKNQRIMNIYSSQQLLPEHCIKAPSLTLKKTTKQSSNQYRQKSKDHIKKDKNKGHSSIVKARPPEIYERIPINIVDSNSNSVIEFSNCGETIKQRVRPLKRNLYISCDQKSFIHDMWNKQKRRAHIEQQSAVKIQKVFRGFMTRKLLQKYIEQYQEKLIIQKNQLKRKATFVTSSQEDSFYGSQLKNSYFLSNKKRNKAKFQSEDRQNLEFQSSILPVNDHYISIQEPDLSQKPIEEEKKSIFIQKQSLILNQSSISPQVPQISLSFGNQIQHSPRFPPQQVVSKKINPYLMMESPCQKNKIEVGLSQDNTRDIVSQNITISPNYKRHNKSEKSQQSHYASIQKEENDLNSNAESNMQKLKSSEKAKWQQVIQFVNQNLKGTFTNEKTKEMMSVILDFSVKNREQLNKVDPQDQSKVTPTTITHRVQSQQHHEEEIYQNFKKKDKRQQQEQQNMKKVKKNENMPLVRKVKLQRMSIFERTLIMKQYFLKNMHLQDNQIDKMMDIRQAILRRKESDSLMQLNNLLENNMLTQQQFLDRLFKMTHTFQQQKKDIEQIKEEIYIGYKAQLQLIKNTAIDAKYLGYHLPFCRSMEIFPNQPKWHFDSVMIDQLNNVTHKKKNIIPKQSSNKFGTEDIQSMMRGSEGVQTQKQIFQKEQSEEDVSFTYQQTNIYKQSLPENINVNQFIEQDITHSPKMKFTSMYNKVAPIDVFQQINKGQKLYQIADKNHEDFQHIQCSIQSKPRSSIFTFQDQSQSEEQVVLCAKNNRKEVEEVFQFLYNQLMWEFFQQIMTSPHIYQTFSIKKVVHAIEPISNKEKIQFLRLFLQDLPKFSDIKGRLNQKMYPNLKQMLFSMRQCEGEQQQQEYIEIGQYQYLLNQQICFQKIQKYLQLQQKNRSIKKKSNIKVQNISEQFKQQYEQFSTQKIKTAAFESTILAKKQFQALQEERRQMLRVQLHVLFDVWNQQLIKHRQNKNGYSGIGLNQLSMSLIDRVCKPMDEQNEYIEMMHQVQKNIEEIVMNQDPNRQLTKQFEDNICKNDSQWILYTQEALQYGFDLVRMIEFELIFDFLNDLHLMQDKEHGSPFKMNFQRDEDEQEFNSEEEEEISKKVLVRQFSSDQQEDSFYK